MPPSETPSCYTRGSVLPPRPAQLRSPPLFAGRLCHKSGLRREGKRLTERPCEEGPRRAAASVRHTVTPSRAVASRARERRAVRRVATALSRHHFLPPSKLASLSLMAVTPTVLHSDSGLSAPLLPLEAAAEAGLLWWLLSLSVAGEDETR
ncbi:uncharacterized protein DS421_15g500430 [Arachis hypogaea]|nr:uncharacterized protein DS421_15g500430 [Arachis hypogaea]